MGDGSKKFSNDVVGCNAPSGQRAPKRYGVAARGAAREVIAKDVGHPTILDPPVLSAGERRADRNARLGFEQQLQRKVHSPR
jgi:hypothetical protein